MNAWEGQVLAIAVKELFEAVKTLRIGGDKRELSAVIRDLLSVEPNIARSEVLLDALEAKSAGRPSPDLFLAKKLLVAIRKQRLLEESQKAARGGMSLNPPTRPGPIPGARRLRSRSGRGAEPVSIPPPRSTPWRRLGRGDARNPDRDLPRRCRRRPPARAIFRTSREGGARPTGEMILATSELRRRRRDRRPHEGKPG